MPEKKMELEWPMKDGEIRGKDAYLLQAYLIKVGTDRDKKRRCGSRSDGTRLIK